jgi:molybdopterin synthase catalytic subunit
LKVELRNSPFEPLMELARYQGARTENHGRYGATAIFIGTMRAFNDGEAVHGMTLEHYPGMTERYLSQIITTAMRQWSLLDALALHRVGALQPNDPIVLIAAWATQRAAAFAACRFIMEELKAKAPFWKREETAAGGRWVTKNSPS